jgi:AGZA family xanthine/uracil permease-like MFS transporter
LGLLPFARQDSGCPASGRQRLEVGLPAFLAIMLMPFTFSITNGVGAGFITYALLKLVRGKVRELHPLLIGVSLVFLAYFAIEPIKHLLGAS